MFLQKLKSRKAILTALLIVVALLSATVLGNYFSSPKTYSGTIQTLDKQKGVATTLSIAVTAASTTLSTFPDDTASPIANELADLSLPLFVIVCILYMEKFLLTIFGWASFTILIPMACLLGAIYLWGKKQELVIYIRKLIILAVALVLIIPVSAKVTNQIQETFSESISLAFEEIDSLAAEANAEEGEESNAFVKFFSELKDNVVSLVETAKNMLGIFTDAIAVLLVTCCVVPILTAILFIWVIKLVFSIDVPTRNLVKLVQPERRKIPKTDMKKAANQ